MQVSWTPPIDAVAGEYYFYSRIFKASTGTNYYSDYDKSKAFVIVSNLQIIPWEGDSRGLENRKPLLLVHGWQPLPKPAAPNFNIWDDSSEFDFTDYYKNSELLQDNYKITKFFIGPI